MALPFENEPDRLLYLQSLGEQFDSGYSETLWGIFSRPYSAQTVADQVVQSRETTLLVRTSDVALHSIERASQLTQVDTGDVYRVRQAEPDGTGMTLLKLSR